MTARPAGRARWRAAACAAACAAAPALPGAARAQDAPPAGPDSVAAAERALALQLQNPVAPLPALPLQSNFEYDVGPARGYRFTLAAQPTLAYRLSRRWALVSRTEVPFVAQRHAIGASGSQFGFADVVQRTYLARAGRAAPAWGVGAVALLPAGTDALLSARKWGLGPAAALVRQAGAWTVGGLADHVWSVAGASDRGDVSVSHVQPFASWTSAAALTLGGNVEGTYDWATARWRSSLNVGASQVVTVDARPASVGLFSRTYPGRPDGAPRWGMRFVVTLLFPRPS